MSNSFSNSIINSTVSKESAPKSLVKLASATTSFSSTPNLSTMIAFYLFPLLLFKEKKLLNLLRNFLSNKRSYFLISLFFVYLMHCCFYLLFPHRCRCSSLVSRRCYLASLYFRFSRCFCSRVSPPISHLVLTSFPETRPRRRRTGTFASHPPNQECLMSPTNLDEQSYANRSKNNPTRTIQE